MIGRFKGFLGEQPEREPGHFIRVREDELRTLLEARRAINIKIAHKRKEIAWFLRSAKKHGL